MRMSELRIQAVLLETEKLTLDYRTLIVRLGTDFDHCFVSSTYRNSFLLMNGSELSLMGHTN